MQNTGRQPAICLGPYGCGTNFLINSLEKSNAFVTNGIQLNAWNKINTPVFKHYIIENNSLEVLTLPDNGRFIYIYKHPLYWFKSLQRMVQDKIMPAVDMGPLIGLSLSDFIRKPGRIVCVERELTDDDKYSSKRPYVTYKNLPDLWNQYMQGYLNYLPENSIGIAYEKLILEPEKIIDKVIIALNGNCPAVYIEKYRRFQNPRHSGYGRDFDEAVAYYSEKTNCSDGYSEDDLAFIREKIDAEILVSAGYDEL